MPTRRLARSNDGDERRRRACVPAPRRHRRTATPAREATTVRLPKSPRSRRVEARARRSGKRFPTAATTDPTTASGLRRRHRRSAATMRRLAKTACFRGCGVERIDRARLGPLPRRARQGSRHAGLDRAAASRRKRHRRPTTRGSRRASGVLFTSSPRVALGRRVGARRRRRSGSRRRDRVPANRRRTRRHRRRRDVDRRRNASADLRFAVGSAPPRRSTSTARRPRSPGAAAKPESNARAATAPPKTKTGSGEPAAAIAVRFCAPRCRRPQGDGAGSAGISGRLLRAARRSRPERAVR